MSAEQQVQLDALLASPVGPELQVARQFLLEWYGLWRDHTGRRASLAEAHQRYRAWREHPAYQAVAPLQKIQAAVDEARFTRLSYFLREPEWEATNNGAERMGRTFRHRQAPHFNLRTERAIEDALKMAAGQSKAQALAPPRQRLHTCQRGRTCRAASLGTGSA